jgi:hypothetical protein
MAEQEMQANMFDVNNVPDEVIRKQVFDIASRLEIAIRGGGSYTAVEQSVIWYSVLAVRSLERQERILAEMSACIQDQKEINKDILQESKDVKWLTKWVVGLTVAVVVLTAAVVGLTIALLVKG